MNMGEQSGYNTAREGMRGTSAMLPTGLGISGSLSHSKSIDTRVWQALNAFAREQEDGAGSETTSAMPSTAVPSVVGGRISSDETHTRLMGPPITIPTVFQTGPGDDYSATEVATEPSVAGTPDLGMPHSRTPLLRASPPGANNILPKASISNLHPTVFVSGSRAEPMLKPISKSELGDDFAHALSTREVQDVIREYGRRIDMLESLSFSQVPVEELQDKFENVDGRLLDLEQWRTDQDIARGSPEIPRQEKSSKRRRLLPVETGSFDTDTSYDSAAAAHTEAVVMATLAASSEIHPRIDALDSRLKELEGNALPTTLHPWHVQIVLLPWGRDLRGIWFGAIEASQRSMATSTQASEEWSGPPRVPKVSFKSTGDNAWTTESIEAWADDALDWLSPKACGPNSKVFQRLASRGLIREITVLSSDAHHILEQIEDAIGHLVDGVAEGDGHARDATQYHALHEKVMPLRKVRKSSRLRFLSPAEMITSASWTAGFLDSSVFMRVNDGQRRLYLTTPEAYLQPSGPAWSWQALRQLPIVDASGAEQAAQKDNSIVEACWTYNDRLDSRFDVHSSFGSHASQWSMRSQISELEHDTRAGAPASPQSDLRPAKHTRSMSLPSSASLAEQITDLPLKRRVASFESVEASRQTGVQASAILGAKRRRISTSPEAERRGMGFTPRLSREPPSPHQSDSAGGEHSQGTSSRRRATTPFAYATPHSNNQYVVQIDRLCAGDGDTEPDTDMGAAQSAIAEEEWQGVEDGLDAEMQHSIGESAGYEPGAEPEDG